MKSEYKTIGKSVLRTGAVERVKGLPIFSADIELDAPLVLKVLRSGRHHAEVLGIDAQAALQIPGVPGPRLRTC